MKKATSILILLLMQAAVLRAQDVQRADSLDGGRIREARVSARTVRVLPGTDAADAAALSAAPTVADAVRMFSGVQIKDYGGVGGLKTVNIRSLGSEHTSVFIDGIPVDNAQNAQVDLGRFPSYMFNGAGVSSGRSVSYRNVPLTARELGSSNSLSLSSGSPSLPEGKDREAHVGVKGGSFSTISPSLSLKRRIRRAVAEISADAVHTSGRYRFHESKWQTLPDGRTAGYDTVMVRENDDLSSIRAFARAGGDSWNASAYWYDSERGLPGPVVRRPTDAITCKDRQEDRDAFVQGAWLRQGKALTSSVKAKYSYSHTRYRTNPEEDPQAMPVDNSFDQRAAWLSASLLAAPVEGWELTAAVDGQFSTLSSDMRDFVYPRRLGTWAALRSDLAMGNIRFDAAIQHQMAADRFRTGEDRGAFAVRRRTRNAWAPSVVFTWAPFGPGAGLTVMGFAKRSWRMPTFNDLYYTIVGNVNLNPEDARQFDAGLRWQGRAWRRAFLDLEAEAFRNIVKDKIVATPTANQFRWTMYNIGKVHITGLSARAGAVLDIGADMGASLTARYTFQRALDRSQSGKMTYGGQIPYVPLHSGSVSASFHSGPWRLDVNFLAGGRRWSSSANTEDFEIAGYKTLDAWISRTLRAGAGELKLSLAVSNLLGEQYEVVKGYPMPGFNIMGEIAYTF